MTITVSATPRVGVSNKTLRANGTLPAVVYGPKQSAESIVLNVKEFEKVLRAAGESTVITITGLATPIEVLIKEVAFSPIKQQLVHVDFYAVEQGKIMSTTVHLEFVGSAPVEADGVGSVNKVLHEVTVTCKPSDLPSHIDVDLSGLKTLDDKVLIKDLKLPTGVSVEADPEDPVAVIAAAKEEVEDTEAAAVDMDSIAVETKGKTEEEDTTA